MGWERVYWIRLAQGTGKAGFSLSCNNPSVGTGIVTVRGLNSPGFESVQWQDTSLQNVQTDSGAPLPQPIIH